MIPGVRSEVWLAKVAGPGPAAAAALAQVEHTVKRRVLAIKASPPIYEAAVDALEAHLLEEFTDRTAELWARAAVDLAELASSPASSEERLLQADARLDRLDSELTAAGRETSDATRRALGFTLATTYRLGQEEVAEAVGRARARKSEDFGVVADFDVQDRAVLQGMSSNGLFWIGEHYGDEVDRKGFRREVRKIIAKEGLGRAAAGDALEDLFAGQVRRSRSYWKGFAATVATRSRSFGALREMDDLGVRVYEYINPDDERTSDVCRHLNGTRFEVKLGIELRDRLLQVQDPEEWKAIAPWPRNVDEIADLSPRELQERGIAWPPLHFHCRSAIEVVLEDLGSFFEDDLEDGAPDEDGNLYEVPDDPGLVGSAPTPRDRLFGPGHGRPVSGMINRSSLLEASDEPIVQECAGAFGLVPKALQEAAAAKDATVHVHRWLPDRYTGLKGRPRGWKRGSWRDVRGAASGGSATMAVRATKGGWGWAHTTLHEWGHAIDIGLGKGSDLSATPAFRKFWKAAKKKPRGGTPRIAEWYEDRHGKWAGPPRYFTQKPPAGPQEFWAEVVAEVFHSPESRARLVKHFPEVLDVLEELLAPSLP